MIQQNSLTITPTTMDRSNPTSPSPSPAPVIHRKPPANYSPMPFASSTGSVHRTVTQFNNLRSASMSSQGPVITPTTTMSKRSFSPIANASPASATKSSADSLVSSRTPTTPVGAESNSPFQTSNGTSDYPPPPAHAEWHSSLKACLGLQTDAVTYHNKRPFAALLLGPDKATILLSHFSISHVQHAESELARLASSHYSTDYLGRCTLVSTFEPCAMCAGTIYWAGIGRVVYGASEAKLRDLTGAGNTENMTMDLPCRTVFNAGQRKVDVVGPVPGWEEKIVEESRKWWRQHTTTAATTNGHAPSNSNSTKDTSLRSFNVVTNPPPAEGVTSRIDKDGEYKADLKVDWMS